MTAPSAPTRRSKTCGGGLPHAAEAVLLCVTDVFVPPPVTEADDTIPFYVPPAVKRAHERATRVLGEARCSVEVVRSVRKKYESG